MKNINSAHQPDDADARRGAIPVICYPTDNLPDSDSHILHSARKTLEKTDEVLVPPREARCFEVPAGQFFRIVSVEGPQVCLLYTSPSPRDATLSRMPSSA